MKRGGAEDPLGSSPLPRSWLTDMRYTNNRDVVPLAELHQRREGIPGIPLSVAITTRHDGGERINDQDVDIVVGDGCLQKWEGLLDIEEPLPPVIIEHCLDREDLGGISAVKIEAWPKRVIKRVLTEQEQGTEGRRLRSVRPHSGNRSDGGELRQEGALAVSSV